MWHAAKEREKLVREAFIKVILIFIAETVVQDVLLYNGIFCTVAVINRMSW